MNLKSATVTGFSVSVTEHGQPAGTCDHCGTGIKYLVHIVDGDGVRGVIGTTCATRIGGVVGECARWNITEEERQRRAARWQEWQNRRDAEKMLRLLDAQSRVDGPVGDLVARLMDGGDDFHRDMGRALAWGPLSRRQAHWAALFLIDARRVTRKNEGRFMEMFDRVCEYNGGVE